MPRLAAASPLGLLLGFALACGGGPGSAPGPTKTSPTSVAPADVPAAPAPAAAPAKSPCVQACEKRREAEATESGIIEAECSAACGAGPAVQELPEEPGFVVVRGKLDAVDVSPVEDLPYSGFGIHAGSSFFVLHCELSGLGDLYGRQVWTRAFRMPNPDEASGEPTGLRDCQGLSVVDEGP